SPLPLSGELLAPHPQRILDSRRVFWIRERPCGFVEPLRFHSALAARHRTESSPAGVLRLSESLLIRLWPHRRCAFPVFLPVSNKQIAGTVRNPLQRAPGLMTLTAPPSGSLERLLPTA